jgi:tyrosyl-tRNA synthetase
MTDTLESTDPAPAAGELPAPGDLLADLRWRGLVAQSTDEAALSAALAQGPITLYCGFDPTAPSLHVGNLVPLLTLRRFQLAGHSPIGLVGGATGLIGDPSGRSSERSLQATDVVADWLALIRSQLELVLDFDGPVPARVVSNLDWTARLTAIELLRDVGKHFSVNTMLAKESVATRLADNGISYTEFSYMILQAYDFLELFRSAQCRLQIGGADQWGNITAGLDLIRRVEGRGQAVAHALTVPLVVKSDGAKFGKTAGGAIWLDATMTSPYAFHQFWLNTDDRDVERFLRLFSLRPPAEIAQLIADWDGRRASRAAQRALADELTTLVHGADETARVTAAGKALFGHGDLGELDAATLDAALAEAPHVVVPQGEPTPNVVELLVATGLCESKGAARRAVKEGGAYLDNVRVVDPEATPEATLAGGWVLLRRGKRNLAGVRLPVAP